MSTLRVLNNKQIILKRLINCIRNMQNNSPSKLQHNSATRIKFKRNFFSGFTLIELLITVAIIGIIAAIAIPNLMNALDKARQKRTMADLRTWGVGLGSYFVDHAFYPFGAEGEIIPNFYVYNIIADEKELAPPPHKDGWNFNFYYWPGGSSINEAQYYTIGSFGKGHQLDSTIVTRYKCFQCDIRIRSGQFYLYPVGAQSNGPNNNCDPANCI